jgi:glycosyltransferase involved in cell wall biosynthesis
MDTIHQFHSGAAPGDAVTNSMLLTRELLRELGFKSEIYCEFMEPGTDPSIRHFKTYAGGADECLIVHHSMGHDRLEWLRKLPAKKLLLYHNITPPEFFPDEPQTQKYARLGRQMLRDFKSIVAGSICVSEYNAEELRALGYSAPEVVPLLVDTELLARRPFSSDIVEQNAGKFTVLFVGRVVPNKRFEDLIDGFARFTRWTRRDAQLVLVGNCQELDPYFLGLQNRIRERHLEERIRFTGKLPQAELDGWFRAADVFLCTSEHEGFGVPLVEAMAFGVPVIAYKSSNIPHTLGGAGLLLEDKKPDEIAARLHLIAEDRALRRSMIRRGVARAAQFSRPQLMARLQEVLQSFDIRAPKRLSTERSEPQRLGCQIEGPFETSYSLALVNRELARALDLRHPNQVSLFATEGPGDYSPEAGDLDKVRDLAPLWQRARKGAQPQVVIRNLYPPRVADADGWMNLLAFAWEESLVPSEWVNQFNEHLDGIVVPSTFVKKSLLDSGVRVPIRVYGHGIEHLERLKRAPVGQELGKSFRFLHVSSAFPRKGVDALLEAYGRAFKAADDVSLVLKTFPNEHHDVEAQVRAFRASPAAPDVQLINEDLTSAQLVELYKRCHAFVAPSRGEGFGLPLAEAMHFGLPVITTAWGGQSDFCTASTAWLVDYEFALAQSHFHQSDSVWTEPRVDDLARAMRSVKDARADLLEKKTSAAKAMLEDFRWSRCAERVEEAIASIDTVPPLAQHRIKLGWVSSWNAKCGIATYSRYLLDAIPRDRFEVSVFASVLDEQTQVDEPYVTRCWERVDMPSLDALYKAVVAKGIEVLVVQFNYAFFALPELVRFLKQLEARGVVTVMTMHSTADSQTPGIVKLSEVASQLKFVDRILVHGISDLNRMKKLGLVENVALFPHGTRELWPSNRQRARERMDLPEATPLVASYGFLLPHKGTEELIEAWPAVLKKHPSARLVLLNALYPVPESVQIQDRCQALLKRLGLEGAVSFRNDFLPDETVLATLEAADLVVFPYQETAESASGAVRFGVSSGVPVAVTPLAIFSDVQSFVHRLPGTSATAIADGIHALLKDRGMLDSVLEPQRRWIENHSWGHLAQRLAGLVEGLKINRDLTDARAQAQTNGPPSETLRSAI